MGVTRLSAKHKVRRIDLMIIDQNSWPFSLLYFTGSRDLNITMRQKAIDKGLTLNEYGLYKKDEASIDATTEADIFKALGMTYLEPIYRNF